MVLQQQVPQQVTQQIPQYAPTTTTAPMPIPARARSSAQPVAHIQQPYHTAQSLPMYSQQPQLAGYPSSSYTSGYGYGYGTPASTQYAPGSVGGSYIFVQERSPSPRQHHHRRYCGYRRRHGSNFFTRHRRRTYSDPEYDDRYRRY